jgi:hypothetical protein
MTKEATQTQEQKTQTTTTSELSVEDWIHKYADHRRSACIADGVAYVYRFACKKCNDPNCTSIVVRYDQLKGNYLNRRCEKVDSKKFESIKEIKPLLSI